MKTKQLFVYDQICVHVVTVAIVIQGILSGTVARLTILWQPSHAMLPKTAMKSMKAMKASVRALSKSGMADGIASSLTLKRRDVTKVLGALTELATKEVKNVGKFAIPGLLMIKTRKKPATKAGVRQMFGKEVKVAAKPAKTVVKAFCNKKIKDAF